MAASIPKRILFAPASGPVGSGEYYRCLAIARAMFQRWPELEIHMLLHRQAKVELEQHFTYHRLDDTPAKLRIPVTKLIHELKPRLALFDCSGRQQQFKAVKAHGGRLVWLSNRPGKRRKGFRWQTLRFLDLHLIMDTDNSEQKLSWLEQWKLKQHRQVKIEFISAIAAEQDQSKIDQNRSQATTTETAPWAVFVSGGGGYVHRGRSVAEIFVEAAVRFQAQTGRKTLAVMGPQYRGELTEHSEIELVCAVTTAELSRLLHAAKLAVIGAGNMLTTQAMTAASPACVLCAVGGSDQPARVARYRRLGAALVAELDAEDLYQKALQIEQAPELAEALRNNSQHTGLKSDTARVARILHSLIED